jgi:hypothetical protein
MKIKLGAKKRNEIRLWMASPAMKVRLYPSRLSITPMPMGAKISANLNKKKRNAIFEMETPVEAKYTGTITRSAPFVSAALQYPSATIVTVRVWLCIEIPADGI